MAAKVKSPHMSRREFTKVVSAFLGGIMGVTLGIPIIGYVIGPALKSQDTDEWIPVGPLENFPLNEPTLFTFNLTQVNGWERTTNSYGAYVLRTSDTNVEIRSNRCTHLSCRVAWDDAEQVYKCPCHNARFSIEGEVLYGPPPRPLDIYETKIEDGVVYLNPTPKEA